MSRDEIHIRQHRNRLMGFSEPQSTTSIHKPPHNVKRKSAQSNAKSPVRSNTPATTFTSSTKTKLSLQDFVRNDPGYTPNIEHLVFPHRKFETARGGSTGRSQSGPISTRSRLAEMFALSRHLQQRSADREIKQQQQQQQQKMQKVKILNVSIRHWAFAKWAH